VKIKFRLELQCWS